MREVGPTEGENGAALNDYDQCFPREMKQFYTEFQIFSSVTTTTVLVMMIDSYAYHRDHLVRDDQIEFLLSSLSNLYFINQTTK